MQNVYKGLISDDTARIEFQKIVFGNSFNTLNTKIFLKQIIFDADK